MTKKEVERWIKDYKIPISITDSPYFEYFLNLYEEDYKTQTKYNLFVEEMKNNPNVIEDMYMTRNLIITEIQKLSEYKDFLNMDMSDYIPNNKFSILPKSSKSFNGSIIGQYFISIDLTSANFQSLKFVSPEIIFNSNNYVEMVEKFTDSKYFMGSKYIRQIIFGALNPKRQTTIQKYIIFEIINYLIENKYFDINDTFAINHDEVVFNSTSFMDIKIQQKIIDIIKEKFNIHIHVESYLLNNIDGWKDVFVKEYVDGKFNIKGASSTYFAQIYKDYKKIPKNNNDFLFIYEGKLAQFI